MKKRGSSSTNKLLTSRPRLKEITTKQQFIKKLTTIKKPVKKIGTENLPVAQQLSYQKVNDKKIRKPLVIGFFVVIVIIGLILYFNLGIMNLSTEKVYIPNVVGKNICVLGNLPIIDTTSKPIRCDTNDECVSSLKKFHEVMDIPLPPQSTLDSLECKPEK